MDGGIGIGFRDWWIGQELYSLGRCGGAEPLHFRSERRQGEVFQELGQVGMTFEPTKTGLNVQEGGGSPARDLVGRGVPAGDLGGLAAIVAHHVLDGVGRQQRDMQGRWDVEPVQGDELVTGFIETGQSGRIACGDEAPQFNQRFAPGDFALGQTQASPQAGRFGVITAAEVAVEIALLVHEAALDEGVGPGGEHRGLQWSGAIEHGEEPVAGHRRETPRLQPGDQRLGDRRVLAGAGLEVQDDLVAVARQPQGHHDDRIGRQGHAVEHEAKKLRAPQIAFPQFGYFGGGRLDPVARSRALAHDSVACPRLAARAHARPHRRHDPGGVVGRLAHRLIARQHMLPLAAVGAAPAHAGPHNPLAPAFGVADAVDRPARR